MSKLAASILFCACIIFSVPANAFDLDGAWTTNPENCGKVFETKDKKVSFTHNSDEFGSGLVVEGNEMRGPAKTCKITGRKESGGILHLIASCSTDIAVLGTQQVDVKIDNDNQLTRIYPEFPEMGIPFYRCKLSQSKATPPAGVTKQDDFAGKLDSLLQQAEQLGAPLAAIQRAVAISRQPTFSKKDVFAVFDISQPSANKRFYLLDFTSGQVTAHFAAHGRSNGPHARATKFKGFQRDLNMVPLGPLKTVAASPEVTDHYRTIVDRYDKTVYRNMIVAVLEGVAPYNRYINHTPPYKWVIHPNWYTTAGYRAKNNGMLGRSLGCITVDPAENNKIITRLKGALIYVTVGDAPIEQYL